MSLQAQDLQQIYVPFVCLTSARSNTAFNFLGRKLLAGRVCGSKCDNAAASGVISD